MFHHPARSLKRVLLGFWAVWLTIVFVTNLFDVGKAIGMLGDDWTFASGNYRFLTETTARHGTPSWLNGVLFAGVICWEALAAGLFVLVSFSFQGRESGLRLRYCAFTVTLALWSAFIVADEIFIAYAVAGTHLRLFTVQLVTLLVIELLPENEHPSQA